MPSDGTTIGVWIGANDSVLTDFDEALECGLEHAGSRSEEAMRLYLTVRETVDEFPYELAGPSLRHETRQALIDKDRREAEQ